jgi:hypothetical protein
MPLLLGRRALFCCRNAVELVLNVLPTGTGAALKIVPLPVTLGPRRDSGATTVPIRRGSLALLFLLGSVPSAFAQRPDDFLRTFGTIAQSATMQGTSDPHPTGGQSSAYAVSGVVLGTTIQFGSSAYREYRCGPSDQFDGFTWCQKTLKEKERRGTFNATYSILHSRDGAAVYVNRYQEPAFFRAGEADADIQRYSRKIGDPPRITRMPHRAGFPNGILASWGKVELEPLDSESVKALAEGRRPFGKGYFLDFIGDFARSAKEGLPIYRISGGAGFVWVASFNQKGRGTLRLTAVDASALAPTTTSKPPIEAVDNSKAQDAIANTTDQFRGEAEKESADKARIDADRAREDAEKARDDALLAKAAAERAVATEKAKVNAVLAQLEAEKGAAEAKARAMEFAAYGAVIGLIVLVVIVASALAVRNRRKTAAGEHRSVKPATRELEPTELAAAIETGSASTGDPQHSESKDARSIASFSPQVAQLSESLRGPGARVIVGITIAGSLSAGAIGAVLYSKTLNPHNDASRIAESTKVSWKFRVKRSGVTDRAEAFVIGWQQNEHGAAAEIIGECVNRRINFKATVLGRDAGQTVELPWDDKLEDYRNEIGRFMQVIYLPIAVKINDDEPMVIKRLHEEPYRNVIRLVTLLSDPNRASDRQQSARKNSNNVTLQLDDLLSTGEKAALTLYYPDKSLKISEARRLIVQFDTSKGSMPIKIMMDDPAIKKLVDFCQKQ